MTKQTSSSKPIVHHRVRTTLAGLFGTLALVLILASLLVVWLNRTLTDTPTFVQTVSPLVSQSAVQTLVADKISDQLLSNVPVQDVAEKLLPGPELQGQSPDQLTFKVHTLVVTNIRQIMEKPSFQKLWTETNQSAHAQIVGELNSNSSTISLNLNPAMVGALAELRETSLAPVVDKLELDPNAGKFDLKGGSIDRAHKFYRLFKQATLALAGLTLLLIILTVWISTHHLKTLRRMLVGTSVIALVVAAILQAPSIVPIHGNDPDVIAAGRAIAHVLFHRLQVACIIIGVSGFVIAIGSKIYGHMKAKTA